MGFPDFPPVVYNFTGEDLPLILQIPMRTTKVKVFDYGATVECVIQGTSLVTGIDHPKRLHGFNFYVVGRRFGNFDQDKDPLYYNLIDPPHKNTLTVPIRGWVVIRFQANNPGKNISKEVRS